MNPIKYRDVLPVGYLRDTLLKIAKCFQLDVLGRPITVSCLEETSKFSQYHVTKKNSSVKKHIEFPNKKKSIYKVEICLLICCFYTNVLYTNRRGCIDLDQI